MAITHQSQIEAMTAAEATEIIKLTLDRMHRTRARLDYFYLALPIIPWIFYFININNPYSEPNLCQAMLIYGWASTVFMLALTLTMVFVHINYRKSVRRRIDECQDTARLIPDKSDAVHAIVDYIPWPYRNRYPPRKYPLFLSEKIELIGKNLDWYLVEPVKLIRFPWLRWLLYFLLMFLACWIALTDWPVIGSTGITLLLLSYWGLLPLPMILEHIGKQHEGIRMEVYQEFMLEYLQGAAGKTGEG